LRWTRQPLRAISLGLAIMLLISMSVVGVSLVLNPAVAVGRSAWLKIVTSAWKGTSCGIYDGVDTGFSGDDVEVNTPMCIDPSVSGFADRFNVTGLEAFVEVYGLKPEMGLIQMQGIFGINATGFAKISWTIDDNWGLLVLVKAKSYYGEEIGKGSPFKGIIIYALAIPPRSMTEEAKEKFLNMSGLYTEWTSGVFNYVGNVTINDDGLIDYHADYFDFNLPRAGLGSGPFDILNGTHVDLASFSEIFGNETKAGTPVNAWVARATKIFKVFHAHSWYNVKDNLSFAQIKIYDLDHTDPTSEASLIQAAVTGEDGQSRYTREIYPTEEGLTDGRFENNKLVPVPLQIFNLANQTVFHGGIVGTSNPTLSDYYVGAPHLNATVRIWWETVVINQTIYYGKYINGSLSATLLLPLGRYRPDFVGPLNIWHNVTNPSGDYPVVDIINATVFYAHFCTFDNDTAIAFPSYDPETGRYGEDSARYATMDLDGDGVEEDMTGQQLVNAIVSINLKTTDDVAYYMTKNILMTNVTGCTDGRHKYRGELIEDMARLPNATVWYELYRDSDRDGIPEYFELLDVSSFWVLFGKHVYFNTSVMYNPGDARNLGDIPEGPTLTDIENPERIGDEDVRESNYFKGNWSILVADVIYAKTLTLKDDKPYIGLDIIVKWKGGWRNVCPGSEDQVATIYVKNPYGISARKINWVSQPGFTAIYNATFKKYVPDVTTKKSIDWDTPIVRLADIVGYTRGRLNITTYVYDVVFYVVNTLGNPLPPSDTEVCLRLPNGNFYCRTPTIDESIVTGMMWSYKHFGEGNATFFQLPGNKGPYGVRITYMGVQVYYKIDVINILQKTEILVLTTSFPTTTTTTFTTVTTYTPTTITVATTIYRTFIQTSTLTISPMLKVDVNINGYKCPNDVVAGLIFTSFSGKLVDADESVIMLYNPNGSVLKLNYERISSGVYKFKHQLTDTSEPGTYVILVIASFKESYALSSASFTVNLDICKLFTLIEDIKRDISILNNRLAQTNESTNLNSTEEQLISLLTQLETVVNNLRENAGERQKSQDLEQVSNMISELKNKLSQAALDNSSIKEDVKSIQERLENIESILLNVLTTINRQEDYSAELTKSVPSVSSMLSYMVVAITFAVGVLLAILIMLLKRYVLSE